MNKDYCEYFERFIFRKKKFKKPKQTNKLNSLRIFESALDKKNQPNQAKPFTATQQI